MTKPVFSVERFHDVYDELLPLLHEHYDEISLHKHRGYDLKPNVTLYKAMQDADQLTMMIGRLDGKIVAYFVVFVRPSIHYGECLEGVGDIFFCKPDRRGAMIGLQLFEATENELKRRGVHLFMAGEKILFPARALFERRGFEEIERKHAKWL
jgi:GNAT superfamily N-acetyltransferase